jgi:GNAT superfamily N-acetyltransferase
MGTDPGSVIIRPVRRDVEDAAGVAAVLNSIITEGRHTALTGHFAPEEELAFLQSLGPRSQLFVAEQLPGRRRAVPGSRPESPEELHEVGGRILGFQVIEPFVTYTATMDHVCQLATYVCASYRGRGIGQRLAETTLAFARANGYEKSLVFVLAGNKGGLTYYRSLGFQDRGVLTRQTKIDGEYHDEVFMEMHF